VNLKYDKICLGLLLGMAVPGHALLGGADPNPERISLGSLQPAMEGGVAAMRENPALLATRIGGTFGVGATRALGMEDLPVWSAWSGWAGRQLGAGVWMRQLRAGEVFREDLVIAGAAWRVGDWAVGASGQAVQVAFAQGLGNAWAGDATLGAWGRPLPWLSVGLSGRQLLESEVGNSGEGLERDGLAGLAVTTLDGRFTTGVSARFKDMGRERPTWQVGQAVRLAPWLALRGAVRLEPLELAFGAGTRWQELGLDFSMSGEGRLGWQQAVAMTWNL
jgi:hypothetical protein